MWQGRIRTLSGRESGAAPSELVSFLLLACTSRAYSGWTHGAERTGVVLCILGITCMSSMSYSTD